jgi:hypothetical protein
MFKNNFEINLILAPVLTFVGVNHIVSLLLKVNQLVGLFLKVNFFRLITLYACSWQLTLNKLRTSFISKPAIKYGPLMKLPCTRNYKTDQNLAMSGLMTRTLPCLSDKQLPIKLKSFTFSPSLVNIWID